MASENTGQDYSPWLTDDLSKLVQSAWGNNAKWVQVTLKLEKKSQVSSLSLYDYEGVFTDKPALIYAMDGGQQTLIGSFDGSEYMKWIPLTPAKPLAADAIMIYKYGNNIPQKIKAFGQPITTTTVSPPPVDLLTFSSANDNPATGDSYAAYLNDNLTDLVPRFWQAANFQWTDVTVKFTQKSLLTKLSVYDYEDVFTDKPALIYAINGTQKTLLGTFTGDKYMVFVTYTPAVPLVADGIVIHKYGNNIPTKLRAYGQVVSANPITTPTSTTTTSTTTTPTSATTTPTSVTTAVTLGNKIPIDGSRWYQLNNTSSGIGPLFDGNLVNEIQTGWGKILSTYDAYYPLQTGESMAIKAIKFYDGNGTNTSNPMRLSIITSDWRRIEIAQFQGLAYNAWVGPYPTRTTAGDARFLLDSVVTGARYLVINTTDFWPREIELYGTYQPGNAPASPLPKKSPMFKNMLGVNAFEWDFYEAGVPGISAPKLKALKSFGVIRHYMDWEKLELTEGNYTFNPTHAGGWNYDLMYERCKAEGMEVMACLKNLSPWMKATYPADQQDDDNVPVRYGKDFTNPLSYIEQAKVAFQYAARYGKNTAVNPALVKVNTAIRWTSDPANVVKIGLGLINYIECDNERDKWWRGRKAYQTGREYAANMSAFYDGHKNTMGAGVGVKNADPSMNVVIGGLCSIANGTDYIKGMIDWCKQYRGYKPDGRVDLCWDVINYHLYPDNSNSMQSGSGATARGAAPELSLATQVARNVLKLAHEACYDMPVYMSETGYDLNQGSPLRAIPIGSKPVTITQADWNLRTALLYGREGVDRVDFFQTYDLNLDCATQFCSMGFLNANFTRKPTADYFYQAKNLMGKYVFKESISTNPNVDRYEFNGQSAYALWIPDEVGRTGQYTLNLGSAGKAKIYTPQAGRDTMMVQLVPALNNQITLTLTETPKFVFPVAGAARLSADVPEKNDFASLIIYPNPSVNQLTIQLNNNYMGTVGVTLTDAGLGISRQEATLQKNTATFSGTLDVSALPYGIYLLEVKQGEDRTVRRILKVR